MKIKNNNKISKHYQIIFLLINGLFLNNFNIMFLNQDKVKLLGASLTTFNDKSILFGGLGR